MTTLHLFLMRGLVREQRHWGDFLAILNQEASSQGLSLKTTCLEIPGSGIYFRERVPPQIPSIVRWMRRDFLSAAHPDEKKVLMAVSLGGMIGVEWLHQFPEDFAHAILMNTSLRGINPLHWRLRPPQMLHLLKIARSKTIEEKEALILQMISNNEKAKSEAMETWPAIQRERPVNLLNSAKQLIAAITYRPPTLPPTKPILFLNSKGDRMVDARCTETIAKKWLKDLRTHPEAGHDLTLDDPLWVARETVEWLKQK